MSAAARSDRVEEVVRHWWPRFLANGIDALDLQAILDRVDGWDDWAPQWTADADRYATLGEQAFADGHRVTAAEHLRRAALTLQFAQFVLTDDPATRLALQRRQAALYARAAPLLDPPAQRYALDSHRGSVVGYLRRPPGVERPGLVVLLPGLESTKEQFSTYEPYFLRRGVATLSVEGPGQGEAGWSTPFRTSGYAEAMASVAAHVARLDDVDPHRLVLLGTSFGGHLALRHAGAFAGLRGVVAIAGPYDLRLEELPAVTREGFVSLVGADDLAQARRLLADVTLDGHAGPEGPPVLVLHGARDGVIDVAHAHRVAAALGARARLHVEPTGNHSCQNLAPVVRPLVADWVADRLAPDPLEHP